MSTFGTGEMFRLVGVAWGIATLLCCVLVGVATAQTSTCYGWNMYGTDYPTGAAYAAALQAAYATAVIDPATGSVTGGISGCYVEGTPPHYACAPVTYTPDISGAPSALGQVNNFPATIHYTSGDSLGATYTGTSEVIPCPTACASLPPMDIVTAIGMSTYNSAGSMCVNGCTYYNSATTMQVSGSGSTPPTVYGQAVSSGASCTGTGASTSNCYTSGGHQVCYDDSASSATVDGDQVNPASAAPSGQCTSYASGGVMCTVPSGGLTTPPAPGTGTTVDTPVATAYAGSVGAAFEYFSAGQVAASGNPVTTTNPVVSGGGSGHGTGTSGTGTGSSTAAGDCTTTDCTGTLPGIPTSDTIATTTTNYMTALQAAPIVAAFAGISTAISTGGECPTWSLTWASHTYVMDQHCVMITSQASVLGALMLALYTLVGFRIVMSA